MTRLAAAAPAAAVPLQMTGCQDQAAMTPCLACSPEHNSTQKLLVLHAQDVHALCWKLVTAADGHQRMAEGAVRLPGWRTLACAHDIAP